MIVFLYMGYWRLLRQSFSEWKKDRAPQLAASTAYYTVFSLAPLFLIVFALAGLVFDAETVRESVFGQVRSLVGTEGARAIQSMVTASSRSGQSGLAAVLGILLLLLGASGLMVALQDAMNGIWKVEARKERNALMHLLFKRVFSAGMILAIGFLFLVSLLASALVSLTITMLAEQAGGLRAVLPAADLLLSLAMVTLLFALLFKYLPDIQLRWRDVWPGALLTAILFTIGKFLLGSYIGQKDVTSAYGVAGSVIVLLLWVNYSAQIFFFGAEFTKVLAAERKAVITPKPYARFSSEPYEAEDRRPSLWNVVGIVLSVLLFESRTAWRAWKIWRAVRHWRS